MAILFNGDRINKTLQAHDDAHKEVDRKLQRHDELIEARVETATHRAELDEASKALSEKAAYMAAALEKQLVALRERMAGMEKRQDTLDVSLSCKVETAAAWAKEEHLGSRIGALEKKHKELMAMLTKKANLAVVEEQQAQLGTFWEQLAALRQEHSDTVLVVSSKADTSALEEQKARLDALSEALALEGQRLRAEVALKNSAEDHSRLLERAAGLEAQLASLSGKLEATSFEVRDDLSRRADLHRFEVQENRLSTTVKKLAQLEQAHESHSIRVMELLGTKQDAEEATQRQAQTDEALSRCATQSEVSSQLSRHQQLIDSNKSQINAHYEQIMSDLNTKLDSQIFNHQWDTVINRELGPKIQMQHDLLDAALEKKDQLIALAEGMQADLRCALALKGRGPSAGPPRLAPLKTPPSPRKQRPISQDG